MERRLRSEDLPDVLSTLLRTVDEEYSKATITLGEYHLFKDHLLSRNIHAVRRVNASLLSAKGRLAAPQQEVAQLAQLPRDPQTNRSSFGDIVVYLNATSSKREGAHEQRQLHASLRRAIRALQGSFGDRLASLSFEQVEPFVEP